MSKSVKISDENYEMLKEKQPDEFVNLSDFLNEIIRWGLEHYPKNNCEVIVQKSTGETEKSPGQDMKEILRRIEILETNQKKIMKKISMENAVTVSEVNNDVTAPLAKKEPKKILPAPKYEDTKHLPKSWGVRWLKFWDQTGCMWTKTGILLAEYNAKEQKIMIKNKDREEEWFVLDVDLNEEDIKIEIEKRLRGMYLFTELPEWFFKKEN